MRAASESREVANVLIRLALWFCALNPLAAQCPSPISPVPDGTYTSGDHSQVADNALLAANFGVSGSATATFVAGNCIQLVPGFHASAIGATVPTTFHAWVDIAPSAVAFSPSNQSGLSQPFTWTVSSPAGHSNLSHVFALFNTTSGSTWNACYIHYDASSNLVYLADNGSTTWLGGFVPSSSGTASNSQCTISGSGSSPNPTNSGTQLSLTLTVTFQTSFSGTKNEYLFALDNAGVYTGWQQMGTWTVPAPCTYSISPSSQSFTSSGGSGTVSVTAGAGCSWTAVSNAGWITVTAGASGSGNGTVSYSVTANAGAARSGTITIAGQTFTVTQSASGPTITTASPLPNGTVGTFYSQTFAATGGTPAYTWSLPSGQQVPYGFTLSSSGVLSGTPKIYNSYSFTIQVTDSASASASKVFSLTVPSGPGISPATTEIAIGGFPVDLYDCDGCPSPPPQNGVISTLVCAPSLTLRQCMTKLFQADPDNFVKQGITGVSFYFPLGAANYSTPFHNDGSVDTADWVPRLQKFFNDLRGWGIQRVSPTPVFTGNWSGTVIDSIVCDGCIHPYPNATSCQGYTSTGSCPADHPLKSYPWLPFGFEQVPDPEHPGQCNWAIERQGWNDAYNCADSNPDFWGWTPWFNLVDAILQAAQNAGLGIGDLTLEAEIDLAENTVEARLIYDTKHPTPEVHTDVLFQIRQRMINRGFDPGRVTFSTQMSRSTIENPSFDCPSVYGDSARLLGESELVGALAGYDGKFGKPSFINYSDCLTQPNCPPPVHTIPLACQGQIEGEGDRGPMISISLPVSYPQPTVTNIHAHHCLESPNGGPCYCVVDPSTGTCGPESNVTEPAKTFYNDVTAFLQYRGLTGNYVIFGETNSLNNPAFENTGQTQCGNYTRAMASENIAGFRQSSLKGRSDTAVRIWWLPTDDQQCTVFPNAINPPYNPSQP